MTSPTARVGGRVVLVDPDGRTLLIHERIDGGRTHWLTPGGGVEDGEDPRVAAERETLEETGAEIAIPEGPAVLVTQRLWSWAGRTYDQTDHFYLARVPAAFTPRPAALTPMETQTLLGHRWWTVDELDATAETVVPPDLGRVVRRLLEADGTAGNLGES